MIRTTQFEFGLDGGFRLIQETATDGERVSRENSEAREIMQRISRAQMALPILASAETNQETK